MGSDSWPLAVFSLFDFNMFKTDTSEGINVFMATVYLGMKIKASLQESILKCVSHVRILMGVISNGKIKKTC